jgi:hypothetical protein
VPEFLNTLLLIPGTRGSVKLIPVLLFPPGHAAGAAGFADSLRRRQDTAYIQSYTDRLIVKLDLTTTLSASNRPAMISGTTSGPIGFLAEAADELDGVA